MTAMFFSHKSYDTLIQIVNDELVLIADWFRVNRLSESEQNQLHIVPLSSEA